MLEDHPLSAFRDCLFNIFAATLHIGGRSSMGNLWTRHAVVTRTHLSWITSVYICYLKHVRTWWKDVHKQCSAGTYVYTRNVCPLNWLSAAFAGLCRMMTVLLIQTFLDLSDNSSIVPNFLMLPLLLLAYYFVIQRCAICFFYCVI